MARETARVASMGAPPPGALLVFEPFSAGGGGGAWAEATWENVTRPKSIKEKTKGWIDFFMVGGFCFQHLTLNPSLGGEGLTGGLPDILKLFLC